MDDCAIPSLLAVIGHPIAGYPMQFVLEQALQADGLEWRVLSFDVPPESLADALRGVDVLGFRGVSIAPHYGQLAATLIPELSEAARAAQWVDALVRGPQNQWLGHNLLGESLLETLGLSSPTNDTPPTLQIAVLGKSPRMQALTNFLPTTPRRPQIRVDLNHASSLDVIIRGGNKEDDSAPVDVSEKTLAMLPSHCQVIDLSNSGWGDHRSGTSADTSLLLRAAAGHGLQIVSAIDLLVARASLAYRLWTGHKANESRLREAFEEYLEI